MGWLIFTFCVIIYLFIGGFVSGAMDRELNPGIVILWPFLLIFLACMVIAKIPVSFGKKYYNNFNKWLDNHT